MMLNHNSDERDLERLRQERETFDLHKQQAQRWFQLQLILGYSALVFLVIFAIAPSHIVFNSQDFPDNIVGIAASALFADIAGLLYSVWKIVLNPKFVTRLAPVTTDQKNTTNDNPLETMPKTVNRNTSLIIMQAKYGCTDNWANVTNMLKAKVKDNTVRMNVTNNQLGIDPCPGIRKFLEVTYSYGGETITKTFAEDDTVEIP